MNGKCSITITNVSIDLYFGLPANRYFFEMLDENPRFLIGEELSEPGIAALLYAGYCNACLIYDMPEVLKRGAFVQYIDEAIIDESRKKEMEEAVKAYSDSLYTKKYLENIHAELEVIKKKISIGTASKVSVTGNSKSAGKNLSNAQSVNSGYGATHGKGKNRKK